LLSFFYFVALGLLSSSDSLLDQLILKEKAFFDHPLTVVPESVTLGTALNSFNEHLELVAYLFKPSLSRGIHALFFFMQVSEDLSPVVP